MPRRHDADAGGPRALLAAKAALRERTWRALERHGASRFPGARGRIPNFAGAEAAAERLRTTSAWRWAHALEANPDAPQLPVRARALEDGKRVYMAVPRLAGRKPFRLLDPAALRVPPRRAASIGGASRAGRLVDVEELEPLDLVVCGSVAVDESGARLGKGGGFSDLEYALACEAGMRAAARTCARGIRVARRRPSSRSPGAAAGSSRDSTGRRLATQLRGRPRILSASAQLASGRPASRHSFSARFTSSTFDFAVKKSSSPTRR
jgi:5-formyltetrahydrofolate cyclo-ligase